jgi:hypothetical protein
MWERRSRPKLTEDKDQSTTACRRADLVATAVVDISMAAVTIVMLVMVVALILQPVGWAPWGIDNATFQHLLSEAQHVSNRTMILALAISGLRDALAERLKRETIEKLVGEADGITEQSDAVYRALRGEEPAWKTLMPFATVPGKWLRPCSSFPRSTGPHEAKGEPPKYVLDFIADHGQSSDWIFRGDPTPMMRMLAVQKERQAAKQ